MQTILLMCVLAAGQPEYSARSELPQHTERIPAAAIEAPAQTASQTTAREQLVRAWRENPATFYFLGVMVGLIIIVQWRMRWQKEAE